jgi:hypothetical protein
MCPDGCAQTNRQPTTQSTRVVTFNARGDALGRWSPSPLRDRAFPCKHCDKPRMTAPSTATCEVVWIDQIASLVQAGGSVEHHSHWCRLGFVRRPADQEALTVPGSLPNQVQRIPGDHRGHPRRSWRSRHGRRSATSRSRCCPDRSGSDRPIEWTRQLLHRIERGRTSG